MNTEWIILVDPDPRARGPWETQPPRAGAPGVRLDRHTVGHSSAALPSQRFISVSYGLARGGIGVLETPHWKIFMIDIKHRFSVPSVGF